MYFICACVTHSSSPKWGWKGEAFRALEFWCLWTHPVLPGAGGLEVPLRSSLLSAVSGSHHSWLLFPNTKITLWLFVGIVSDFSIKFIVRFDSGPTKKGLVVEGELGGRALAWLSKALDFILVVQETNNTEKQISEVLLFCWAASSLIILADFISARHSF